MVIWGWRWRRFLPHPTLSGWERAFAVALAPPLLFRPPPSFRRRPESRTPVGPGGAIGRGVDFRFRGNDELVGGNVELVGGNDGLVRAGMIN